MKRLETLGGNRMKVINPVVQLKSNDEIYNGFKFITDSSDLAVVLYRTTVLGKVLGWDLMQRLAGLETVVGIKQGVMNRVETLEIRNIIRPDFIVSDPFGTVFCDDLRKGGQALFAELSYILYGKKRHIVKDYMALSAAGKWEEAYQASEQLNDIREFYNEVLFGLWFKHSPMPVH